jgi:hypothetical protein
MVGQSAFFNEISQYGSSAISSIHKQSKATYEAHVSFVTFHF